MTARRPLSTTRICGRFTAMALRRWRELLPVVATIVLTAAVNVIKPWPLKVLIDNVLGNQPLTGWLASVVDTLPGGDSSEDLLLWVMVALILVYLADWFAQAATLYTGVALGQRLVYDLSSRLFSRLQRLSLRFHARRGTGDLVRRMTSDTQSVATIVNNALLPVASSLITLVSMVLVMWSVDALLTVTALIAVPLFIIPLKMYATAMAQRSYERQCAEGKLYDTVESTLTSMPVVKAYAHERYGDRLLDADADAALAAAVVEADVQLRFKVLTGLALAVGTAAVVWVGGTQALNGELTVGTIVVYLSYLASLYAPLEALMYSGTLIQEAVGSGRRVFEIVDAPAEVIDAPGARSLHAVRGQVGFHHVDFGYEPERPVLVDVDLTIEPGETVAIVGATGAGKSTLVSLVPRFHDADRGTVTIDGADVRSLTLDSVRANVALVLQESFLFPMTIAENIAYGRPNASPAEVVAVARAANIHDVVMRLPAGYDTVVGERGATLSGGERQRVAIARALLKDAPILVLDEPTSALDSETETLLLDALDRLMAGRTTLIIAHRLSTIRNADRIVVVRGGAIAESGTHHQLVAEGGIYANLVRLQHGVPIDDADAEAVAEQLVDRDIAARRRPPLRPLVG